MTGTRGPRLTVHPRVPGRLDLLFVGDTAFGENYQAQRAAQGRENILESRGYLAGFEGLAGLLGLADLVVANLETPLSHRDPPANAPARRWQHKSHPERSAAALRALGIRALSLANNHSGDLGAAGLMDTLHCLDTWDLTAFGAGRNAGEAALPLLIETIGPDPLRCAVLAGDAGRWAGPLADPNGARAATAALRVARRPVTHVAGDGRHPTIAFPHWGANYLMATPLQRRLADQLLTAGVDLILGHGAHCLQEIEERQGRLVAYSLGNFMFPSPGRYGQFRAPPYSLAAWVRLADEGAGGTRVSGLRLYPIVSDNRRTDYRPRPVAGAELAWLKRFLAARCPALQGATWSHDRVGPFVTLIDRR